VQEAGLFGRVYKGHMAGFDRHESHAVVGLFFKRKLGGFFVSWFKPELAYINPRVGGLLGKAVNARACVVCVYGGVLVDEVVEWNENVGRVTLQTVVNLYPEAWEYS